jgi:type 1 fimbria pilin
MMLRMLTVFVAALAIAAFVAGPARADDKASVHEGEVVKASAGKLTMTGEDKKQHTHDVAKDAAITLDGKKAKLEDLKAHAHVKVTVDDKNMVTKIEAHSPAKR